MAEARRITGNMTVDAILALNDQIGQEGVENRLLGLAAGSTDSVVDVAILQGRIHNAVVGGALDHASALVDDLEAKTGPTTRSRFARAVIAERRSDWASAQTSYDAILETEPENKTVLQRRDACIQRRKNGVPVPPSETSSTKTIGGPWKRDEKPHGKKAGSQFDLPQDAESLDDYDRRMTEARAREMTRDLRAVEHLPPKHRRTVKAIRWVFIAFAAFVIAQVFFGFFILPFL